MRTNADTSGPAIENTSAERMSSPDVVTPKSGAVAGMLAKPNAAAGRKPDADPVLMRTVPSSSSPAAPMRTTIVPPAQAAVWKSAREPAAVIWMTARLLPSGRFNAGAAAVAVCRERIGETDTDTHRPSGE